MPAEPWTTSHSRSILHRGRTGHYYSPWQASTSPLSYWCTVTPKGATLSHPIHTRSSVLCVCVSTPEMKKSFRFGGYIWLLMRSLRIVQSSASVGVWTPAVSISLPTQWWRLWWKKMLSMRGRTESLAGGLRESRSEIKAVGNEKLHNPLNLKMWLKKKKNLNLNLKKWSASK